MRKLLTLLTVSIVLFSCESKDLTIKLDKVGHITANTTIKDLEELFKNDSIVSRLSEGDLGNINDYVGANDTYLIYKRGGELQLSISPINYLDSISKIRSVTVFSKDYQTEHNVGLGSTFNKLNINHNISKLEASFNTVTVFVKDINATFTIDKQDLGIKTFTLGEINKSQIPEESKFTSFTMWFNENK